MKKHSRLKIEAWSVAVGVFLLMLATWPQVRPRVHLARDIERTVDLLAGDWVWFGPEITGGGHLPGPFFYILMSLGFLFGAKLFNCWVLLSSCVSASTYYLWRHLRARFELPLSALLFSLIFSSVTIYVLLTFLNSSFILPAYTVCVLFRLWILRQDKHRSPLYLGYFFLLGLSLQLHGSFFVLLLGEAIWVALNCRAERTLLHRFGLGLVFLILPLVPYFAWKLNLPVDGMVMAGPFRESFSFHMDMIRHTLSQQTFSGAHLWRILTRVNELFPIIPALAALLYLRFARSKQSLPMAHDKETKFLAVLWWVFLPLQINFVLSGGAYERYVAAAALTNVMLMAAYIYKNYELKPSPSRSWTFAAPALAVSATIITLFTFGQHTVSTNQDQFVHQHTAEWVAKTIRQETGWNFEEFSRRLYFVNFYNESEFSIAYREALAHSSVKASPAIDGFFLLSSKNDPPPTVEQFTDRLLAEGVLMPFVQNALRAQSIVLQKVWTLNNVSLASYKISNPIEFLPYVHNVGRPYDSSPLTRHFGRLQGNQLAMKNLSSNEALIAWKNCNYGDFCHHFLRIEGPKLTASGPALLMTLDGDNLAQRNWGLMPFGIQALKNLRVSIRPEQGSAKNTVTRFIADSVGLYSDKFSLSQQSLLAPLSFWLKLPSTAGKMQVDLVWEGLRESNTHWLKDLPGRRISFNLDLSQEPPTISSTPL